MPTDWEATLRAWVKPPSDTEDSKRDRTEKEIKAALAASSVLAGIRYEVYAKGSYANNTNVRLDYDVDVAVECHEFSYYSSSGGAGEIQRKSLTATAGSFYKGGYTSDQFKRDVEDALVNYYGRSAVTRGNMAMRVREKKTTLPADVVPCFEYHQHYDVDAWGNQVYHLGTRVYKDSGGYIHNWPRQQKDNGIAKNNATSRRYKRMARALKRLENVLVSKGLIEDLPSFLIECLVYNVPNSSFSHANYVDDMRAVLAYIFNQTLSYDSCKDWPEVNERKWLFGRHQKWSFNDAHGLADAAWDYVGFK